MPDSPPARAEARVDLAAIRANVAALDARTSAATMAVVKADGYGHGAVPAARAALAGGAAWLGVAYVEEALALRAAGVDAPVLALITTAGDRLADAIAHRIDLAVGSRRLLDEVVAAASGDLDRRVATYNSPLDRQSRHSSRAGDGRLVDEVVAAAGSPARIHLEADTGLSRGGAGGQEWADLVDAAATAQADGAVEVVGVWSHLACADDPGHPANAAQIEAFDAALSAAKARGVVPQLRHLANSAATLALPAAHYDLVRPGIAIYGLDSGVAAADLTPAMTLVSHVGLAKRIPAGQGVSYGHTYTAPAETGLALVPVGYGDGIPRHASNRAEVLLGRRRRRVAGRVCMDQFMVATGPDTAAIGDEVVVFGPGQNGEPTADEWAAAAGTIGYEIVTRIGARVPRVYVGDA